MVYVRDQAGSLKFVSKGWASRVDAPTDTESGWVAVVPADGSVLLVLLEPRKGSEESFEIGSRTGVGARD
jgi:hypothetical protein